MKVFVRKKINQYVVFQISAAKKEEDKKELIAKMTPEELEKYKDRQEKKRVRKMMSKQSKKVVSM